MTDLLDVFVDKRFSNLRIEKAISKLNGILMVDGKTNEVSIRLDGDKVKEFLSTKETER